MAFEKVVSGLLWTLTAENDSLNYDQAGLVTGGTGVIATHDHIMSNHKFWDHCVYTTDSMAVSGGATGGSYTITIVGTVAGFTGLPIARLSDIGPNSPDSEVIPNLHNSTGSIIPTGLSVVQGNTGAITVSVFVDAKTNRGVLSGGATGGDRVLEGVLRTEDALQVDATRTTSVPGGTTFSNTGGMHKMRFWDQAMYWVKTFITDGTWEVDIVGKTHEGTTITMARTGTGGTIAATEDHCMIPIPSLNFAGQSFPPVETIWTEVGASTGGISASVIFSAKTSRGIL